MFDVCLFEATNWGEREGSVSLEKRAKERRKRRSRVLPEVVRCADSADARRIEKMVTTTISTTTVVMT
jgi:hypothetical protein